LRAGTGYVYDPLFLEHDLPGHPENRARLEYTMAALADQGLLARMQHVPTLPVDEALLHRIHDRDYVERVRQVSARGAGYLDTDTYVTGRSYDAALLAAGGTAGLARAVLRGALHNGIALVRPPGHHAERARGMGFCIFNNVAVAACAALDEFGLERVLIYDWDVHHGNGTQAAFYESPQVLYISTHQSPHYPGTGDYREAGTGPGAGFTVNLPLPTGVGDRGFDRVLREAILPLAERFRPQLVLVSAGYDAHWRDPLAGLHLSLGGYWRLATAMVALAEQQCGGRIVVVLEGGYDLKVQSQGVADTCRALLGDEAPAEDPIGPSTWRETPVEQLLAGVRRIHSL